MFVAVIALVEIPRGTLSGRSFPEPFTPKMIAFVRCTIKTSHLRSHDGSVHESTETEPFSQIQPFLRFPILQQ